MLSPVLQFNGTIPTQFDGIDIPFPYPLDFWALMAIAFGITFGRAFGKKIDQYVQESDWFRKRGAFTQEVLRRMLDMLHHWWMGVIIMWFCALQAEWLNTALRIPESFVPIGFWFGFGLFLDDARDVQHILKDRLGIGIPEEETTTTPPTTIPPITAPPVNP